MYSSKHEVEEENEAWACIQEWMRPKVVVVLFGVITLLVLGAMASV